MARAERFRSFSSEEKSALNKHSNFEENVKSYGAVIDGYNFENIER